MTKDVDALAEPRGSAVPRDVLVESLRGNELIADVLLSNLRAAGFAIVPREPTQAMKMAALQELSDATVDEPKAAAWDAIRAYRAMLRASASERPEGTINKKAPTP